MSLTATNGWGAVTNVPVSAGKFFYVTNALSDSRKFYRLVH